MHTIVHQMINLREQIVFAQFRTVLILFKGNNILYICIYCFIFKYNCCGLYGIEDYVTARMAPDTSCFTTKQQGDIITYTAIQVRDGWACHLWDNYVLEIFL